MASITKKRDASHLFAMRIAAASQHQQRAEVVDVGEGGPRHDEIAEGREEAVGVVA